MNTLLYQPRILSIMPTWQCNAACADCGTQSSPHVRTKLSTNQVVGAIETAAAEGFSLVVFTGGEATLAPRELRAGLKRANSLGLTTRIVTNGWWAKSNELAAIQVGALVDDGLDEINFSTGDEHVRFVPLERVLMGIRAAIDRKLAPVLMIELRTDAEITEKSIRDSDSFRTLLHGVAEQLKIVESPWMPLEHERIGHYPEGSMASAHNLGRKTGCDSLFETHWTSPASLDIFQLPASGHSRMAAPGPLPAEGQAPNTARSVKSAASAEVRRSRFMDHSR